MKKIFLTLGVIAYSFASFGQILITDPDLDVANPMDCDAAGAGPTGNFFDSGGDAADYAANENEVFVVCPDYASNTSKLSLTFGINAGLAFDVHESDTIYVYDGPTVAAPLLGKHNSSTDPNGFNHLSTFINNPTGCFTVKFVSDGANEGAGWKASVKCIQQAQPFDVHMAGYRTIGGSDVINPADTGYIDMCFGDSILYVANPDFAYSSDVTGVGYSQNASNTTYTWNFSSGMQFVGDSVWFKPPARSGYIVTLKVRDSFPQTQQVSSKVRVSTIPSFSGVLNSRDSVCVGDTTVIIGAVTASDTAGVDPTDGGFQLGGSFAGLVYLPDGSGINYTDTLNISGFVAGDTVTSVTDLEKLCLTMEHSYLGDLEMQLTCPNGTTIAIFNSYSPGIIPAGFSGGGTFLGRPIDDSSGPAGEGEQYCWSSTLNTWGNFPTEFAAANFITVPNAAPLSAGESMNWNGVYLPEQSFADFVGCPLNGDWYITVRDNLGTDDGYIFEWGILFDPTLNPNNEVYAPTIVAAEWLTAASILPGEPTDTFIVVTSNTAGEFDYTFEVTDNFGCIYDTTVAVQFLPTPTVQNDVSACNRQYQITGTTAFDGGIWTYTTETGGTLNFALSDTDSNPYLTVDVDGAYVLTYTDNQCGIATDVEVFFAEDITVDIVGGDICLGDEIILDATSTDIAATYLWSDGTTDATLVATSNGTYAVVVTGTCNTNSGSADIITRVCNVTAGNVVTPNGDGLNDYLFFSGLDDFPTSRLEVFNRWGLLIYAQDNYRNDWSPTSVVDGTYFYVLTPNGSGGTKQEPLKGSITILK